MLLSLMAAVHVALASTAAAASPLATESFDTARFRLVYTPEARGAAHQLGQEIEQHRDDIAGLLGRDFSGRTEVRLGYGREQYEALALPGGVPPSWAVALAYPDENVMLLEAHSLVRGDGQLTLRHELVHIALGRLGHQWPRWFHEGLAQQLNGEHRYSIDRYSTLARAVSSDRIFKLSDLAVAFPDRPADVEIAYAQCEAFMTFLRERHPRAEFGELVDNVARGETFEIAFAKAFHTTLNLEEREFNAELPRRYPLWPVIATGTTLWVGLGVLVVFGWVRRRKAVELRRARQADEEAAEDAAEALLAAARAAVETIHSAEPTKPPPEPDPEPPTKPTLH